MKQTTTLLIAILLTCFCQGQKMITTYYDYNKIHPHEQYYVNAAGQKTGLYKEYNQNGVVTTECTYQNDLANGVCTTYWAKANNQRSIGAKGTYKNGVLDGPSVSYDVSGVPLEQGNYVNGIKDGKWAVIAPVDDPDIDLPAEGYKYLKSIMELKNGEIADGLIKVYYYPSGKLYREFYMKNGKETGEQVSYYPNGKLKFREKLDARGKQIITEEGYYQSGRLKTFSEFAPTAWAYTKAGDPINLLIKEEFTPDGHLKILETPDDWIDLYDDGRPSSFMETGPFNEGWKQGQYDAQITRMKVYQRMIEDAFAHDATYWLHALDSMISMHDNANTYSTAYMAMLAYPMNKEIAARFQVVKAERSGQAKKEQEQNNRKENAALLTSADRYFEGHDYVRAKETYQKVLAASPDTHAEARMKEIDVIEKASQESAAYMSRQAVSLRGLYDSFTVTFKTQKTVPFFVDAAGQPLKKDYYPKGEQLYRKADAVIKQMIQEYNNMPDSQAKGSNGKTLCTLLDKLIALPESDAKELEKKVKKLAGDTEVKQALLQL